MGKLPDKYSGYLLYLQIFCEILHEIIENRSFIPQMISRKSIDEVIERARIEEVVGDFVHLKRRGGNFTGLCPFHHEKTPSFSVSPSRNIFKCFGCGKVGDPVRFVMEHEGYDFPEAIRYLAGKYNIQLEETQADAETIAAEKERESIYKVLDFAWTFFKNNLHQTEAGRIAGLGYFRERGFHPKTVEAFGLGFAPDSSNALVASALSAGYTPEILQRAGLMTQHNTDFFRNRVMFPIFNISGKVIAFAGRMMTSSDRGPKYINSPETEIYNKRKVLYGLFQAKRKIREEDNCYLVEGYTDVISLHQAGIEHVVASSGTALTPEQIRLIKRYASRITVLYDSDPAGIRAAMRGMDLILEENLDVRLALLPDGDDPDSFVQRVGMEGFNAYMEENSRDFILFKTQLLLKETAAEPMRKAALVKDLVETLARIPEAIKRSTFITEVAHQLKLDEQMLIRETNRAVDEFLRQQQKGVARDIIQAEREVRQNQFDREAAAANRTEIKPADISSEDYQEIDIVRILLNYGEKPYDDPALSPLSRYIIAGIDDVMDELRHPVCRSIIEEYRALLAREESPGAQYFIQHHDPEIRSLAIGLLTVPYEYASWDDHDLPLQVQPHPDENFVRDATHAILRLKLKVLMRHIQRNQEEISRLQEGGMEEEMAVHVKLHYELLQMRDQITGHFKNVVLRV